MTRRRLKYPAGGLVLLGHIAAFGPTGAYSQVLIKAQEAAAAVHPAQTDAAQSNPAAAVPGGAGKSAEPPGQGNPLWKVPLSSLSATRERPIFSPSRRPPPVTALSTAASRPQTVAAPNRPQLSLVGAIAGKDEGIAIFLDETTKSVVRLRIGESHSGWSLRTVKAREVILQKDRQTIVFAIPSSRAQ
jgi:general secretion pathway protein N